ncbi:MAG: hypothetical protein K0U68_15700 [Gammaproteobacteria bacterium]|nr:hypothetical protein [Gammaproteobacteria bacterium]
MNDTNWFCKLDNIGVISVTGHDNRQFLQGQTTCDFNALEHNTWTRGALCNPKGRVLAVFDAIATQSGILLLLSRIILDKVLNRLKMFVLRADVVLTDASDDWEISGLCLNPPLQDSLNLPGSKSVKANHNNVLLCVHDKQEPDALYLNLTDAHNNLNPDNPLNQLDLTQHDQTVWDTRQISAGIPIITDYTYEAFTPHMLNLDLLDAISFNKGCYTGQEVIARTQYLGTLKRRMFMLSASIEIPPEPGTTIVSSSDPGNISLGQVVRSSHCPQGSILLAVLQTSAIDCQDLIIKDQPSCSLQLKHSFDPEFALS